VHRVLRGRVRALLVAEVTANGVRIPGGGDGEPRESAVAFTAEGPALERPIGDGRPQHVPHEDALAEALLRDPVPHVDDAATNVRHPDARERESGARPGRIRVVDVVETR
jgi:hypothetical protein